MGGITIKISRRLAKDMAKDARPISGFTTTHRILMRIRMRHPPYRFSVFMNSTPPLIKQRLRMSRVAPACSGQW